MGRGLVFKTQGECNEFEFHHIKSFFIVRAHTRARKRSPKNTAYLGTQTPMQFAATILACPPLQPPSCRVSCTFVGESGPSTMCSRLLLLQRCRFVRRKLCVICSDTYSGNGTLHLRSRLMQSIMHEERFDCAFVTSSNSMLMPITVMERPMLNKNPDVAVGRGGCSANHSGRRPA